MVGKKYDDITDELDELEVTYEKVEETSETVEKGIIISVDPKEGEEISAATTVKITVSKGSAYADVTMQNLVGKTEAEAKDWLSSQKLVAEVVYEENASKSDGVVTAQSVAAGKVVKEASSVTITVNKQPVKSTVTVNVNLKAVTGYTPKTTETIDENGNIVKEETTPEKVKVVIKVGDDTIYDQDQYPTTTDISARFTTTGVKEVKVIVGGVTKKAETVDFSKGDTTITAP